MKPMQTHFARMVWGLLLLGAGFLSFRMISSGAWLLGSVTFALAAFVVWVYSSRRTHAARYLLPGLATFAIFVLLPLIYTVYIAFTNFSGEHLLSEQRVREWFAKEEYAPYPEQYAFTLHSLPNDQYQLEAQLRDPTIENAPQFVTAPFSPREILTYREIPFHTVETANTSPAPLPMREIIATRPWLNRATFTLPGQDTPLQLISLRALGYRLPVWQLQNEKLVNSITGQVLVPDPKIGNFVDSESRQPVGPGWRVPVGWENFKLIFGDPAIRTPFLRIFGWNISFAFLSVLITFSLGIVLAALLQWKALRGRAVYRTLLILPYAIPAFIPILVFRGLFNENFGEINLLFNTLFGVKPHWFTDPWLARAMILLVNTWLGYPYMMIISSGMLQTIPDDLYEASAIDGANPVHNFFRITLPQIFPPLFPLLIASFAFNFNNFNLIYLLTGGRPDMVGSATIAGTTDLLVSYTFRMAFKDSAARFGFASAIATLLFLIVAILAWQQLRFSRQAQSPKVKP